MGMTTNPSIPPLRTLSEVEWEALFKRLNLTHTRRIYQQVAAQAEKESWSYTDFLALLLTEEVARRKQRRLQQLTRNAHFPFLKTIDEFDFSLQSTLRQALLGSYLGIDFVGHRTLAHSAGQDRPRQNSSGRGHRLSRHPERLRDPLYHRRRTDRGSLQCQHPGQAPGVAHHLHPPPRADHR